MTKTETASYISAVALVVGNLAHITIGSDIQDAVATIIVGLITAYGIWKNHRKPQA